MISDWKALLERNSAEWGVSESREAWSFLLHNNYQPHYSNLHVLWFRKDRYPVVVTKVFPERVLPEQEFLNLKEAYACAPEWVPRPFGLYEQGRFWTLWMSAAPGRRLLPGDLSETAVDRFCDGLATIHNRIAARRSPNSRRFDDCVREPLEAATQKCVGTELSGECIRLRAKYTESWLGSLRPLPQHGDLYGGNVIVDGPQWRILDWETLGRVDLPFYDLLCFLFSIETAMPRHWGAALRQYAARSIARYSAACGCKLQDFTFLLPLLLANRAHMLLSTERKAKAIAALQDYFRCPLEWERSLIGTC